MDLPIKRNRKTIRPMTKDQIYNIFKERDTIFFKVLTENVDCSNKDELILGLKSIMKNDFSKLVIDITGVKFFDGFGMNFLTFAERLENSKNSRVKLVKSFRPNISNEEVATAFFKAHNA